jgi:hypothetical protein
MKLRIASACVLFAACAYRPGAFEYSGYEFPGRRFTFGCVDAAIALRVPDDLRPAISYELGNRCDQAAMVDLGAAYVTARASDGPEIELIAFDPLHEIRPAPLDGRMFASEAIQYRSASSQTLADVCVDPAPAFGSAQASLTCFALGGLP